MTNSHIKFWIILFVILLLAIPIWLDQPYQARRIQDEVNQGVAIFGKESMQSIVDNARAAYQVVFMDTELVSTVNKAHVNERHRQEAKSTFLPSHVLSGITNDYLRSFSYNIYGIVVRLLIICHWLLYLSPLLMAALLDALCSRRIRFHNFSFTEPRLYAASIHAVILLLAIPFIYLVAPIPITPLFFPQWTLLLTLPLVMMIINTNRMGS